MFWRAGIESGLVLTGREMADCLADRKNKGQGRAGQGLQTWQTLASHGVRSWAAVGGVRRNPQPTAHTLT